MLMYTANSSNLHTWAPTVRLRHPEPQFLRSLCFNHTLPHPPVTLLTSSSTPPRNLDVRTTLRIGTETLEVQAADMDRLENLGRGAYGTVDCMRHRPTSTLMAVKVRLRGWGGWGLVMTVWVGEGRGCVV